MKEKIKKPKVIFSNQNDDDNLNSVIQFFESDIPDMAAKHIIDFFGFNQQELFSYKGKKRKDFVKQKLIPFLNEQKSVAEQKNSKIPKLLGTN